jgi:hypothetical protein
LAAAPAAGAATNLVSDGQFNGVSGYQPGNGAFAELSAAPDSSSTGIPGWVVASGTVDWSNAYWNGPNADDPFTVDLNGSGPGALEQVIPTTSGQVYTLSFELSANPDCGQITTELRVNWDGAQVGVDVETTPTWTNSSMVYAAESATVTGTGTDTLDLVSENGGSCGPVISDVSLSSAAAPTSLSAEPQIVLSPPPSAAGYGNVTAVLTSNGSPIAGKTIAFSEGTRSLCTATTDPNGVASCHIGLFKELDVLFAQGYQAKFSGDSDYASSSASAKAIERGSGGSTG